MRLRHGLQPLHRKGRSPTNVARDRRRRADWLIRRAGRHETVPKERIWLLDRLCKSCEGANGAFARFSRRFNALPVASVGRSREIFPMGDVGEAVIGFLQLKVWHEKIMCRFVNLVIMILNFLFGVGASSMKPSRMTTAQTDVARRIADRCNDFYNRLQGADDGSWEHLLPDWVPGVVKPEGPKYAALICDAVDVLDSCGMLDPLPYLPAASRVLLSDASAVFPAPPPGLAQFDCIPDADRPEYVKLVAKQLRSGTLGLRTSVSGGGTVLVVTKPGTGKLREIWHGKRVSQAAAQPFPPRHLASPTALLHMEASADKPLRVSKRDAKCWFDQLALPEELREWMGRPPVSLEELEQYGGMSKSEVALHAQSAVDDAERLFPVSHVWPMGFSWSSHIAQEVLLSCCREAGLGEDCVLACDAPTPSQFVHVFAAATDDAMFFSNAGPGVTSSCAQRFDKVMAERGAIKHPGKDVDDELDATCVGVRLEGGTHLAAPPARCLALTILVLALADASYASPKEVHSALSMLQWYDLLRRPKLSTYRKVYSFVQYPEDTTLHRIPPEVVEELLMGLVLGVFWKADLCRPFLPLVAASDASTEYGFGASVARLPQDKVRELARVAEKQGTFVTLDSGKDYTARTGVEHKLGLPKAAFVHVFSVKKKRDAHINILEGEAFVVLLRWLLRCRSRHCSRIVILVDSAVWQGAAAKGRSSTSLNRLLRKVAALTMAGDLHLHLVLVPSAENPSDEPSRGVRVRKTKTKRRPKTPSFRQLLSTLHAAAMAAGASAVPASFGA